MQSLVIILVVLSGLEWWLPVSDKTWLRRVVSSLLVVGLLLINVNLYTKVTHLWWLLFAVFSLYRGVNCLRLYRTRIPPGYIRQMSRQTTLGLTTFQLLTVATALAAQHYDIHTTDMWYFALALQLTLSLVLLSSTIRHLRTTAPPLPAKGYADKDLPALTVAIPARNETSDLEACLQLLTASTYPKLEILVLDDCSPNKRTPEIIRSFAQSGVRFIAGESPSKHWLAKNYAYHQLAAEASGELLLFCGVDTRLRPESLRVIVETLLDKRKTMLSLLPKNSLPEALDFGSLFVQPTRYAWELSLPRRLINRPPVLSTCWLITAEVLRAAGGFEAVSRSSSPESYFARYAAAHDDGYSFLVSNETIGLSSAKEFSEQQATAIRTRYPQLHRRIELAALFSLAEVAALVLPFVMLPISLFAQQWGAALASGLCCFLLTAFYAHIVELTYRKFLVRGLWLLPFAAAYDIVLLNSSMWQYEFGEVIWKGRNVCIPVMRTDPTLPGK